MTGGRRGFVEERRHWRKKKRVNRAARAKKKRARRGEARFRNKEK